MKNTFILFLVALSFVCSSCNRTPSVEEPDVLKVELKETPVSVSDFFSKVEVIPLETSDSCLIGNDPLIQIASDRIIVMTSHQQCFAFDKQTGKFLHSIGHVGDDPEACRET